MDAVIFKTVFSAIFLWISAILTLLMILGLACFHAGLVRAKNTIDIFAKYFIAVAVSALCYFVCGHNLTRASTSTWNAYLPDVHLRWPQFFDPIDRSVVFFNLFIGVIPLAAVIGVTAERLKLWSFILFSLIASLFIFPLIGFWVIGKGYLHSLGFWDVTGGSVMHLSGAAAALAALLLVGARKDRYSRHYRLVPRPGNIPLAGLGIFLFWIGSMGYLSGGYWVTTLQITQWEWPMLLLGMQAISLNVISATVGAFLSTLLLLRLFNRRVEITFLMNSIIAGVVAIAPSPQNPTIFAAFGVGVGVGMLLLLCLFYFEKFQWDDPSGILASFGVGSLWGLLASVVTRGFSGMHAAEAFDTWIHAEVIQLLGVLMILGVVFLLSMVAWLGIRYLIGLRVKSQDEFRGLDIIDYGAPAYPEFTDSDKN